MKESCKKCYYWDRTLSPKHSYKCYGGKCPAKLRDDKEKLKKKRAVQKRRRPINKWRR